MICCTSALIYARSCPRAWSCTSATCLQSNPVDIPYLSNVCSMKNATTQHLNVDWSQDSLFLEVGRVSVRILSHMRRDKLSLFHLSVSVTLVLVLLTPLQTLKQTPFDCLSSIAYCPHYQNGKKRLLRVWHQHIVSYTPTVWGSLEQCDTIENLEASDEHPVGLLNKINY